MAPRLRTVSPAEADGPFLRERLVAPVSDEWVHGNKGKNREEASVLPVLWAWGLSLTYAGFGLVSEAMNQLTFGFHPVRAGFMATTACSCSTCTGAGISLQTARR